MNRSCMAMLIATVGLISVPRSQAQQAAEWQYGAFVDGAYEKDFNNPANDLFRSRGTAYKVDEPMLNMAAAYLRKTASESSRWGMEATLQAGLDTRVFGFSATAPNLEGSSGLRHLGPTDVSYLAPVGKGLTIQAGIFPSFIGYDSLYAKDNFNYTRPWGADFTPYLMLGVNASYPVSERLTAAIFVISGYWHLAHANNAPTSGGQIAYKATNRWTLKQTAMAGPHQANTSLEYWRVLSDSIAEWKRAPITLAGEYQISFEKVASPGNPTALWMSTQMPVHWQMDKQWSVSFRPEVAWDRDGRWTGFAQTVEAFTSTLEFRVPYRAAGAIFRLEHRYDHSTGPGGGFFTDGYLAGGLPGLKPGQHLLIAAVILTFDSSLPRK